VSAANATSQAVPAADARIGADDALISLMASAVRRASRDISLASRSTQSTLDRTGPQRITDLARLEGLAQPSMTALAGALERDGFAVGRRGPSDRRVVLIGLTAAGTDLIRRRHRASAQALAELIDKLPPGETAAVLAALPALRHLHEPEEAQRASTATRLHNPLRRAMRW
jgi:DNA-binding MarR family transcriptional regulator